MQQQAQHCSHVHHQPHLEVLKRDLVLVGVGGGQRFDDGGVVAFSPQELGELLQHDAAVVGNLLAGGQFARGLADILGEVLQAVGVLFEQTEEIKR